MRDKKLLAFLQTIENTEVEEGIFDTNVMTALEELDNFTKVDLIKKVLSLELRRFSNEYLSGPDLNAAAAERGTGSPRESNYGGKARGKRLFISIGSKDGLDNTSLKEFVANTSSVPFKAIVGVEVKGVFSFLNVEDEYADQLVNAVNGTTYKDRPVRIEISGDRPEGGGGRREGGRGGYGGSRGGSSERRSYGGNREGGERKSYGGGDRRSSGGGERRSYGGSSERNSSGSGEKRSYGGNREGGERKPYGSSGSSERRSYGGGEKRTYGGNSGGTGERKKRDGDFPPRKRRDV